MRGKWLLTMVLFLALVSGCRKNADGAAATVASSQPTTNVSASSDGKVVLRIAQWGFIVRYENQIEEYARSQGVDLDIVFPKPYLIEIDDVFQYIRSERADVAITPKEVIKSSGGKLIKILEPIDLDALKNYPKIDDQLRTNPAYCDMDRQDEKTYAVPYRADVQTLLYDSSRVGPPKSYDVLMSPDAKGKYCLQKYQREANIRIPLAMLGYKHATYYDMETEKVEWGKVCQLTDYLVVNASSAYSLASTPNIEITDISHSAIRESLYIYGMGLMIPSLDKICGKWQIAPITNGIELWVDGFCISSSLHDQAEKLQAAHIVIDYLLSAEMQMAVFKDQSYTPVTVDARKKLLAENPADSRLAGNFFENNAQSQACPRTLRSINFYQRILDDAAAKANREKEFIPK